MDLFLGYDGLTLYESARETTPFRLAQPTTDNRMFSYASAWMAIGRRWSVVALDNCEDNRDKQGLT